MRYLQKGEAFPASLDDTGLLRTRRTAGACSSVVDVNALPLPSAPKKTYSCAVCCGDADDGARGVNALLNDRPDPAGLKKRDVDQDSLRKAWDTSQRSTQDDWAEWMSQLSFELLRESSSPALRACSALAQVYHPLARELFNAGFVSCYTELEPLYKQNLVESLEQAFAASAAITPEVLQVLLNLAEFMERDEKPLPIDIRTLGRLAMQCHAYAKALHLKEMEFQYSPETAIEALITINSELGQHEAVAGVLKHARDKYAVQTKESWYEKLNRWRKALGAYERRRDSDPNDLEATLGMMRCLNALGKYDRVSDLSAEMWRSDRPDKDFARRETAPIAAKAAWGLAKWDDMEQYVGSMRNSVQSTFYSAILAICKGQYATAHVCIEKSRDLLDKNVSALVGESYNRAYDMIVKVQQLSELEEIIEYKQCSSETRKGVLRQMWQTRLLGARRNVVVWTRLLNIRRMVIPITEEPDIHVKFVSLCAKSGEMSLAAKTLASMMGCAQADINSMAGPALRTSVPPSVAFCYLRFLWLQDAKPKSEILTEIQSLAGSLADSPAPWPTGCPGRLVAKIYRQLGSWQKFIAFEETVDADSFPSVLANLQRATDIDKGWHKAWHEWALMHYEIVTHYERKTREDNKDRKSRPIGSPISIAEEPEAPEEAPAPESAAAQPASLPTSIPVPVPVKKDTRPPADQLADYLASTPTVVPAVAPGGMRRSNSFTRKARSMAAHVHTHVIPAAKGFFQSIALTSGSGDDRLILQDILRLLTLWFKYGAYPEMDAVMVDGFDRVSIDNWLQVIPQLIARIHTPAVQERMHDLLNRIAQAHPQALIFPLAVTTNSPIEVRKVRAQEIMDSMKEQFGELVEEARLVAKEQIRVAILWHEMWHEGLEEASRLWFAEKNVDGMFQTLKPLHQMMEQGPETMRENAFLQTFGRDLAEALKWCNSYSRTGRDTDLNQAWDLYYHVFRRISRQLPQMTTLELQAVSPRLLAARNMNLAVPGTYRPNITPVLIESFVPSLSVIPSKQRPRKLTLKGSDGRDYMFLLKGHEDIRQDERVSVLFLRSAGYRCVLPPPAQCRPGHPFAERRRNQMQ